ncbi:MULTISPECIES: hypothetical protein [Nostocales]|uniref:Uncharacterized protein n=3 Tax=Nostocales TaxID=1161 RepID=A0A8S9TAB0_9CYAN|nr:hypothetical protein [Tolypothrix bouteillei]KAF3888977.1 hypothetical protein DA73_0400028460 [Tolypothrix bouteillei VB521301]
MVGRSVTPYARTVVSGWNWQDKDSYECYSTTKLATDTGKIDFILPYERDR